VQSLGKDFYAMDAGALSDLRKATYLRASFLLAWRPRRGAFLYTDDPGGNRDPWNATAVPNIGTPVRRGFRVGAGYERIFTRGVVLINPGGSGAQKFSLHRRYVAADRSTLTTVTLAPGTAEILRRISR
jgi:hypothetical protein